MRIFTNILPSKLPLPEDEGYHFCDICERWVSSENRHCYKCGSCTSKVCSFGKYFTIFNIWKNYFLVSSILLQDGRTYIHCNKCARCVKPTWQHCNKCKRCLLAEHKCGDFLPSGCFSCHQPGHKKNECPLRTTDEVIFLYIEKS